MRISSKHREVSQLGFTLVELILVIVLVAIISTFAVTKFSSIDGWKQEGDLRRFASTWQFLFNEAYGRAETYRLVVNLDDNYYQVLREAPLPQDEIQQVDLLQNLRTRGEQERRKDKELDNLDNLEEAFAEFDRAQSGPIENQYYNTKYRDGHSDVKLTRPLDFPKLAEKKFLVEGLNIRDVILQGSEETQVDGEVFFRFTPHGASDFAVIHFTFDEEQIFTAVSHPATGELSVIAGDKEYDWDPQNNRVN